VGWALTTDPGLNHAPCLADRWRQTHRGVTAENAGERCYLRLERQTFSRLPRTRAVLFTIHTYRAPIGEVLGTVDGADRARRLAGSIRTMPTALQGYKKLEPYREALLGYLDGRAGS
jgi:dimethylamine monooxygenase subunit A